jgi:hypothetical protein
MKEVLLTEEAAGHWTDSNEPVELPTAVKDVLTLSVNSRQSISNAVEVSLSRGIGLVPLPSRRPI